MVMNTKFAGATLLALALLTGLMWVVTPTPMPPATAAVAAETWELPELVKDETNKHLDLIVARNLWRDVVQAQPVSASKPEWRFVGVVTNGRERSLLISIDNKPAEMLQVGGKLPGGSEILKINEDRICILINGQKRTLPIYRQ